MRKFAFFITVSVLSLALSAPQALALEDCRRVEGTMNLNFIGFWSGDAKLTLDGQILDAKVTFTLISAKETKNGIVLGTETAVFDFGNGNTFTEQDHFVFGPTNNPSVWHYRAVARITEGTGKFKDAVGRLVLQGTVLFSDTGATYSGSVKGNICDSGEDE